MAGRGIYRAGEEVVQLEVEPPGRIVLEFSSKYLLSCHGLLHIFTVVLSSTILGCITHTYTPGVHYVVASFTNLYELMIFLNIVAILMSLGMLFVYTTTLTEVIPINWKCFDPLVGLVLAVPMVIVSIGLFAECARSTYNVVSARTSLNLLLAAILGFFNFILHFMRIICPRGLRKPKETPTALRVVTRDSCETAFVNVDDL